MKNKFIAIILVFSILLNVIFATKSYNYKYKIGQEAYNNIASIKILNESNKEILNNVISTNYLENNDLLKLYKNYSDISVNIAKLWEEYNFYRNDSVFNLFSKSVKTKDSASNEVHWRIEEYINKILETEMTTSNFKLTLEGNTFEQIKAMSNLSNEIDDLFAEFRNSKLKDVDEENKAKVIINNKYWIDLLTGINTISEKYIDEDFSLDNK
ncbi:MAG: hypothetical protein GX275_07650 [Clostridiales bacterium]|nr:hypothetical protein [Clostridiales bacterium]